MTRENALFLFGGLAFGVLLGFGLFQVWNQQPDLDMIASGAGQMSAPAGPMAPTQTGGTAAAGSAGGAPMMDRIRELNARIESNPDDVAAMVELANMYHDVGMWDQAIGFYERALVVRPDEPDLLTDLGVCYRGKQEFDQALVMFSRAHEADPKHWQSLFNSAVVAGFDLQRFDDALATLAAMEAMTPPPPRLTELRQALERARDASAQESS